MSVKINILFIGSSDIVATDGGRFDVDVKERNRKPVYWSGDIKKVRRCSWFKKGALNTIPEPYEEDIAEKLEVSALNVKNNFINTGS